VPNQHLLVCVLCVCACCAVRSGTYSRSTVTNVASGWHAWSQSVQNFSATTGNMVWNSLRSRNFLLTGSGEDDPIAVFDLQTSQVFAESAFSRLRNVGSDGAVIAPAPMGDFIGSQLLWLPFGSGSVTTSCFLLMGGWLNNSATLFSDSYFWCPDDGLQAMMASTGGAGFPSLTTGQSTGTCNADTFYLGDQCSQACISTYSASSNDPLIGIPQNNNAGGQVAGAGVTCVINACTAVWGSVPFGIDSSTTCTHGLPRSWSCTAPVLTGYTLCNNITSITCLNNNAFTASPVVASQFPLRAWREAVRCGKHCVTLAHRMGCLECVRLALCVCCMLQRCALCLP